MNNQQLLLKSIQRKIDSTSSLIEEIARVLNISYDASHRRVSMKSKFSIEEAVQLCLHYDISMDNLIRQSSKIVVEKTSTISKTEDLAQYLKESYNNLKEFQNKKGTQIYYSAKDIPLFYTIGGTLLSKFKLYVWSNLLTNQETMNSFDEFHLTQNTQQYASELQKLYNSIQIHEIWNDTTINSTVQQISYFFESGLIDLKTALHLFDDVKQIIITIEKKCNQKDSNFNLYYNELIILNNNVLIVSENKMKLFIPYNMLGYFITTEEHTINDTLKYFNHQLKNSKYLNFSGVREQKAFFNKAIQKINWHVEKVNNYFLENNF